MFGAHGVYIISVYSLFVALIAWHLITPLVQLSALKRRLQTARQRAKNGVGVASSLPS